MKKLIVLLTAICLLFSAAGCGQKKKADDGIIRISIGNWPSENEKAGRELYDQRVQKMKKKYPNVEITPDVGAVDVKTFLTKAASGQLPNLYVTYFTEASKIINEGYARDITSFIEKYGYKNAIKEPIMDLVTSEGKIYGLPTNSYAMGLMINMELFSKAGLINEDGTPKIPRTYDEVAEYSQIINEKTGKAGFILPTTNNCGGWHFMNIAWSYGVKFMEDRDGKWYATFDSPEAVAALQYVKDLKWKYNALPANTFIDQAEMYKQFATGEGAMYFSSSVSDTLTSSYGMSKDSVAMGCIPAGPKGKYSLMGGGIDMFSTETDDEQLDACFKWLEISGVVPAVTENTLTNQEATFKSRTETGLIIGPVGYDVWQNREGQEKLDALREKYINVDMKFYEDYIRFEGVEIKPEEPVNCQPLYKALDACIQEVLNNKNADPEALIKKAANDFQKNYLD